MSRGRGETQGTKGTKVNIIENIDGLLEANRIFDASNTNSPLQETEKLKGLNKIIIKSASESQGHPVIGYLRFKIGDKFYYFNYTHQDVGGVKKSDGTTSWSQCLGLSSCNKGTDPICIVQTSVPSSHL